MKFPSVLYRVRKTEEEKMEKLLEKLQAQCQAILETRYQSRSRLAIDLLALVRSQTPEVKNQLLALIIQTEPQKFCDCPNCSLLNKNLQDGLSEQRFEELNETLASQIEKKIIDIFKTGGSVKDKSVKVRKMIFSYHDFDEQAFILLILQQTIFIPYREVPQIDKWSELEIKTILTRIIPFLPQLAIINNAPQFQDDLHIIAATLKFLQEAELSEKEKTVAIAFLFTKAKQQAQKQACQECPAKKLHDSINQAIENTTQDDDSETSDDSNESSSNSTSGKFNPALN